MVGIMMLKHFQLAGHKPLALVGGATGMIGDPSGKSQERNLLDEKSLRHNQECIQKQLAKFLDFDADVPNKAEMVNNYDWMKSFSFLDFIRDVGKHITACRLPSLLISWFRAMIFYTCMSTKTANCRWADLISGAISPPERN